MAKQDNEVFWRLEVEIIPGKLEEFQSVMREQIASAEQETGTLDYEWYFNADDTVCHTYERYRDSDAIVTHASTFGEKFAERVLLTCRPTGLDVYGAPNAAARTLLDAYNPTYYPKREGFHR
jgi:quinol monooxygenase YgiN